MNTRDSGGRKGKQQTSWEKNDKIDVLFERENEKGTTNKSN